LNARTWLPLLISACACTADGSDDDQGDDTTPRPPLEIAYEGPHDITLSFYPYEEIPLLDGKSGEFILGQDPGGVLIAWTIPPGGATVELYVSETGQGAGPCTFEGGVCAGILDPVLKATLVAGREQCGTNVTFLETFDGAGECARFELPWDMFDSPGTVTWQALVYPPGGEGTPAFTDCLVRHVAVSPLDSHVQIRDATESSGLGTHVETNGNTHAGGVGFVDVNNDYWPDIFIANGGSQENRLFLNNGDGTFTDDSLKVDKPDVMGGVESASVAYADIDNDGDLDIMVPSDNPKLMVTSEPQPYEGGPNLLYVNNGDGTFVENGEAAGVVDPRGWRNSNASFADYDLDGCVDLFLLQWAMAALPAGDNFDRLLRGNCDGTFDDVTHTMPIDPGGRDGLGVFWWDADFDMYPELYVGNNSDDYVLPDFDPRADWYKNDGGVLRDWHELPDSILSDAWAAMGVDVGDIDGDMDWDFYVTDVWYLQPIPQGNALYLGEDGGKTLSVNKCREHGLCFGYNSWPTNFVDFDNDGWVDLWVGASLPSDPDILYINRGDGTGTFDPHRQPGWTGHIARAGTATDYDGDGRIDVFLWPDNDRAFLYRNDSALPGTHWVELRLLGTASNAAAIGARVELTVNGQTQMRKIGGGDSAHSQMDLTVHFGLGPSDVADQIDVFWPSGQVDILTGVAGDTFHLVREGEGLVAPVVTTASAIWNEATSTLLVTATSNYGGRGVIEALGYGPLVWNRPAMRFEAAFPMSIVPLEIELAHGAGATIVVPVE
jgi:hypothetical protein